MKVFDPINSILFEKISPGMFRLMLALLVVLFHSTSFITLGHYAVYVFFILSGYWIFKMYLEKYRFYHRSYVIYLISRFWRLIPIYWLILALGLICYFFTPTVWGEIEDVFNKRGLLETISSNVLLLNLNRSPYQFLVPAWSLDIELQFYILAPLLAIMSNRKNVMYMTLGLTVLALIFLKLYPNFVTVITYLPFFLIGGGIYLRNYLSSKRVASGLVIIFIIILLFHYLIPDLRNGFLLNKDAHLLDYSYSEFLNVIFALLTIPFLSINIRNNPKSLNHDRIYSSMSFIIYLLHWPLLKLYEVSVESIGGIEKLIYLIVYYLLCIGISWLLAISIDPFFEKQRRNWLKKQLVEDGIK